MRELVLNDASIATADQSTAIDWLADIAKGMSSLVINQVVQNTLRTSRLYRRYIIETIARSGMQFSH